MNHYLNAVETLSAILDDSAVSMDTFNKKTYKVSFENTYQRLVPAFDSIEALYNSVGDPEQMLENMAGAFTDKAQEKLDSCSRKNAREGMMMTLNMQLAVFIYPAILQYRGESSQPLADAIGRKWKEVFPKSNVSAASYETIEEGFRKKFCYITTAVCENTGRGDDCYELTLLRDYRDGYLSGLEGGEELVRTYYDVAPSIVKHINSRPDRDRIYRDIFNDHIRPCIQLIEAGRNEACAGRYQEMVYALKAAYFYTEEQYTS